MEPTDGTWGPGGAPSRGTWFRLANQPPRVRLWVLLGYWAGIFALTHWPELDDLVAAPRWLPKPDKIVHFSMYAGWAAAWGWWLAGTRRPVNRHVWAWLLAGGAAYAVFDELTQALVAREPSVSDWLADMTGLGAAVLLLAWRRRRRIEPGRA